MRTIHAMRIRLVALAAAGAAVVAGSALAVDTFVFGSVAGRVAGTNEADVKVRWALKCLGDKLGAATYEFTLVAVRVQPEPQTTVTIRKDTTKTGSTRIRLPAGSWQIRADPFLCETERGAGSTRPEIGQTVEVPDYCSWVVRRVRGAASVETASAVKRARPGSLAAPGSTLVAPAGGSIDAGTPDRSATAALGGGARVGIDAKQCRTRSGWRLALQAGAITVSATAGPDAARDHDVATPNAVATGRVGRWSVAIARSGGAVTTVVRVRKGSVRVKGKSGAAVTVAAGFRTTVAGGAAPSAPTRG